MTDHKTSTSTVTYNNYPDKNAEAARITKCDETYRKGIDSKYFDRQMESEHFLNGCCGSEDKALQSQFRDLLLTKFYLEQP